MIIRLSVVDSVYISYGARLEVPSVHPGLMAACLPWRGGYHAKSQLADLNCAAAVIALQRDVGEGTVTLANHGLRFEDIRRDGQTMEEKGGRSAPHSSPCE